MHTMLVNPITTLNIITILSQDMYTKKFCTALFDNSITKSSIDGFFPTVGFCFAFLPKWDLFQKKLQK